MQMTNVRLANIASLSNRLEECKAAANDLLASARLPSAAVEYLKNGPQLMQAVAQFKLELLPLELAQSVAAQLCWQHWSICHS